MHQIFARALRLCRRVRQGARENLVWGRDDPFRCCVKLSSLTELVLLNYGTSLSLQTVPSFSCWTHQLSSGLKHPCWPHFFGFLLKNCSPLAWSCVTFCVWYVSVNHFCLCTAVYTSQYGPAQWTLNFDVEWVSHAQCLLLPFLVIIMLYTFYNTHLKNLATIAWVQIHDGLTACTCGNIYTLWTNLTHSPTTLPLTWFLCPYGYT